MQPTPHRRGTVLVAALIAVYILTFTVFTLVRYARYNATGWDLGIYTQLTWNASRGHFMHNTIAEYDNFLAIHATYTTILLGPLFWLWADPRMLLIVQTVVLALGAWPIARLAARTFREWWIAPLFALLWLLYPSVGWINRWDFHPIALAATFLAFAFEAADRKAWRQVDVWLLLTMLSKEEGGLNVAFFGLYMLWRYQRRRTPCAIWFVVGIAWFIGHAFIIFPALRGADNGLPIHANRYEWLLEGDLPVIWHTLTGPDLVRKLLYPVKLLAPVAFVALLAPIALVPALPTLALSLLSDYPQQFEIYMHYNAPVIPAVLVAAIFGLAALRDRLGRRGLLAGSGVMLAASLGMWILFNPLTGTSHGTAIYAWETGAHIDALNEARTLIPPDACVVAENNIQPPYSVRPETYVLGARGPGPVGDADGCAYMIVDLGDERHDDFTVGEEVACFQFWAQKRVPIYYRDTVVILQQAPASADSAAQANMAAYCDAYAAR